MPARIDLNHLEVFAAVADLGSFTAAAERLALTKARVSQQIGRLETQLGATLFTRTTRRVTLTDAGAALHARSAPLLRGLREALAEVGRSDAALSGTLRIASSIDHAAQGLAPVIAAFAARHPDLVIDLRSSDRVVDLVKEGIDLAVRVGWLRDSSLHATRLGEFEQYLVAAPAYLERAGTPRHPSDLAAHDWIALTLLPTPLTWKFTSARNGRTVVVRTQAHMRVDTSGALRALLVQGAGISVLAAHSLQDELRAGHLVRVLPDWRLPAGGIHAVYPPTRHVPARVRAFIDFYRDFLRTG